MYIGPYIKILKHKTIEKLTYSRECVNDSCDYYGRVKATKFCSNCGQVIVIVPKQQIEEISAFDLMYQKFIFFDGLYEPEDTNNILLPNKKSPFDLPISYDIIELSTIDTVLQIDWMWEEYKDQIAYLRQELGDENVIVGYGVISSY